LLSAAEAATMLGRVRLGAQLGLLPSGLDSAAARGALLARSAVLQVHLGRALNDRERAVERARLIRGMLN